MQMQDQPQDRRATDVREQAPLARPLHARRLVLNLLVAFCGLLAAFLSAEVAFRVFGIGSKPPPIWQIDFNAFAADPEPNIVFTLRPGYNGRIFGVSARYNSLGMREDEIPSEKAPGEFRVLALGDSITYGFAVSAEAAFPKVLERVLNITQPLTDVRGSVATMRRFRVLNAGVPAYNTHQEYLFLKRLVVPVKPDLVLLSFTISNDYETAYRIHPDGRIEPTEVRIADFVLRLPLESSLGRVSNVYRFFGQWIKGRVLGPRYRARVESIFRTYREDREGWRECKKSLEEMKSTLYAHSCKFALFVWPEATEKPVYSRASYPYLEIHALVEQFCREQGIAYLDVLDDFLAFKPKRDLFIAPTDAHPSPTAHQLLAHALLREISKQKLIPDRN